MQIEYVNFYPISYNEKKDTLNASLHIYFPELDLDIRNILVIKKKDKWIFLFPNGKSYDPDENKIVHFPIFNFREKEKNQKIAGILKTEGVAYIETHFFNDLKSMFEKLNKIKAYEKNKSRSKKRRMETVAKHKNMR